MDGFKHFVNRRFVSRLDLFYFILSIFLCNLWKFVSMYFVWLQFELFYDVG